MGMYSIVSHKVIKNGKVPKHTRDLIPELNLVLLIQEMHIAIISPTVS